MTYALSILKDKPRGLWVLDNASVTDATAAAGVAVLVAGSGATTAAALVSNGGLTPNVNATRAFKFPSRIYKPGYEKTPFSLEAWVFPNTTTANVVSRVGEQDGIGITNDVLTFKIRFAGSTAQINYPIDTAKNLHVVGTYTPSGISLYVNGEHYKQLNFTEAQQSDTFATATDNGNFYAGGTGTTGNVFIQAVAIYEYALSLNQVRSHYKWGRDAVNPDSVAAVYGGRSVDVSFKHADTFLRHIIGPTMSWYLGDINNLTITSNGYLSQQYEDGVLQEGIWTYGFDTDYDDSNINSVLLQWEGSGTFTVETSVDGNTWSTATNNEYAPGLTPGTNPSHLFIKITFPENGAGQVHNLDIVGFKTNTIEIPNRVLTLTNTVDIREEMTPLEYRTDTGLLFEGSESMSLAASTEEGYVGEFTYEYWYYTPNGTIGLSAPGSSAFYQNGAVFDSTRVGSWNLLHLVSSTAMPYLQVSGDIIIGRIAVYPRTLTATECANIYKMYTGKLRVPVDNDGTITVSTPSVEAYSSDWSNTSAG